MNIYKLKIIYWTDSVLILFLVGKPTIRGFFCDDESLRRPYHDSTISNAVLYAYGFTLPFVMTFYNNSYLKIDAKIIME